MEIQFIGGVNSAIGACTLVSIDDHLTLIDCGLVLDPRKNGLHCQELPFRADRISSIILTNASVDHAGCIPRLVKEGFRGTIYCSPLTYELCRFQLMDHAHAVEEDRRYFNSLDRSAPDLPFAKADVEAALEYFTPVEFFDSFVVPWMVCTINYGGHFPGSSQVVLDDGEKRVFFSGKLGRELDPIVLASAHASEITDLVIDSTFGHSKHSDQEPERLLEKLILRTVSRGGQLLIPVFNIGRIRALLLYLSRLKEAGRLPNIPIYHDCPYSIRKHSLFLDNQSDHILSPEMAEATCKVASQVESYEDSLELMKCKKPKVILAGNARLIHGRALRHFENLAGDPRNTIALLEHQPFGSRGDLLLNGKNEIEINGKKIQVKAEVFQLDELSSHADSNEIMSWLKGFRKAPQRVYVTQGENRARENMKKRISDELGWNVILPEPSERVVL